MSGHCETCVYFLRGGQHPQHTVQMDGQCRRYPPHVINVQISKSSTGPDAYEDRPIFPRVMKDTNCGEHKAQEVAE